jgi:hypothetical protein
MLACHHSRRLLRDPRAEERARRAFDALVEAARRHAPAAGVGRPPYLARKSGELHDPSIGTHSGDEEL